MNFRVLLVDDNPGELILLEMAIRERRPDWECRSVDNPARCLEIADQFLPHVIITDYLGVEAQEVICALRRNPVHRVTPIIVLTGLRDPDRIREVCSLGANACLEKPMGYEELANLVDATLSFWGLTSLLAVLHGSHSEPFTIDNLPPRAVQRVAGTR